MNVPDMLACRFRGEYGTEAAAVAAANAAPVPYPW